MCLAMYCKLLDSNSWILALDLITWPLWAMSLRVLMATVYSTVGSVSVSQCHLVALSNTYLQQILNLWGYESILLMLEEQSKVICRLEASL